MRYSKDLADSLLRLMRRTFNAPESDAYGFDSNGQYAPGAFVFNVGSTYNGIAWGIAMITGKDGGESTVVYARTFGGLVDKIHAMVDGASLAARVAATVKEGR